MSGRDFTCRTCYEKQGEERFSLGLYAGIYCDECWDKSGFREEGREGFDPMDAGEQYDPEPSVGGLEDW